MAKLRSNLLTSHLRGRVGDLVYKWYGDKVVVTRVPQFRPQKPSKAQKIQRQGFKAAMSYAQKVLADPERRAAYAPIARKRRRSIQVLAISDFLKAPRITAVDGRGYRGRVGGEIVVLVGDRFKVIALEVVLRDAAGRVIEQGPAKSFGNDWHYLATVARPPGETISVEATATDRPGHTTTRTETLMIA
jgi:hypothetical protein